MKHNRNKRLSKLIALLMLVVLSFVTVSADTLVQANAQETQQNAEQANNQVTGQEPEQATDQMTGLSINSKSSELKKPDLMGNDEFLQGLTVAADKSANTGFEEPEALSEEVADTADTVTDALSDEQIEAESSELRQDALNSEWSKYSSDYYYNKMSAKQKLVYDRLEASCNRYMTSAVNCTNSSKTYSDLKLMDGVNVEDIGLTKDEVNDVIEIFYEVEGQYYFLRNKFIVSYKGDTYKATTATLSVYDTFANGNTRSQFTTKFKNQINSWVAQVNKKSSKYDKQKAAHDLICEKVTYKSNDYDQSVISAMLGTDGFNNQTVCAGYAKAFQLLCNATGVESIITVSQSHAWDYVNIDGNWYIVDSTWDDEEFYSLGINEYLDINYDTLKLLDYTAAHEVLPLWQQFMPSCSKNYIPAGTASSWKIGDNITATVDSKGNLKINGKGKTYTYTTESGKVSPLVTTPYARNFRHVEVSEGVTDLSNVLMMYSNVTSVTFHSSVTGIGGGIFLGSSSLTKITNNSDLHGNISILTGVKYGTWKNVATGKETSEMLDNATVQMDPLTVRVAGLYLNRLSLTMEVGQTYNLKATVYPSNATNKNVAWSSGSTKVVTVDNGKLTAHKKGYATIKVSCDGYTKYCNVKVVEPQKNGVFQESDGNWYFFRDGKIDYSYTGLANNESGWWFIRNGVLDWGYTGLASNESGWWYVENGGVNFGYTGLVQNENGWWYVQKGGIDFGYSGLVQNENGWWCVQGGKINFDYTGLANDSVVGWWYVQGGAINFGATGLVANEFGWWYVQNGGINFNYTGLVCDPNVGWWYVQNGGINFGYTGLIQNESGWWRVEGGAINFGYTGLANDPVVGWWYVEGGAINFGATGLVANEFGWWYVQNGGIDFNYTGLVFDPNVGWWYVQNGGINFGYTGKVANEYGTWNVVNGQVIF